MVNPINYSIPTEHYHRQKNPELPKVKSLKSVLPLKVIAHGVLAAKRARETDFAFLQDVLISEDCPEFNGYNARLNRVHGQASMPKTKASYLPLIDMTPSDPNTMMTALAEAQRQTAQSGQDFTVFTCDQQLYRVAMKVIWAYPEKIVKVVLRLGGMHTLMSFVGSVGTLMAETGLTDVMEAAFAGTGKMLTGKKFPQNVRALRMVVEELLRRTIEGNNFQSMHDLMSFLEDISSRSKTAKLWIDCLVKPVFVMMMYIRGEREGEWTLHLQAVKLMLPYFFAAGHVNYARYGLYYLRTMESLPSPVLDLFMKGQHVMRHT